MKTNVIGCSALTIGLLVAVQAFAQAGDRTVSGTISSSSSSRITTARLSIKNIANGDTKSVSMKRDGSYVVRQLLPGVATARTQASGQAQRGFGTEMTISGGRPRQNDSRLDGISVNDYSNGPPGSALGVNLGVDAVEQFSVLTSNYPAPYGRSSGGII